MVKIENQKKPFHETPVIKDYSQRIDRIVNEYEDHITHRINKDYLKNTTLPDRLADRIAAFGGSWKFIIFFGIFLFTWIVLNTLQLTRHFDAPPFILLNLILSFIAAFQAPLILMSQNRQASRDKHEAIIDFAINYKAELEIDDMQSHLHRIEAQIDEITKTLHELRTMSAVPSKDHTS